MNRARVGGLAAALVITATGGVAGTTGAAAGTSARPSAAIVAVPKPYSNLPDRTVGKVFFTTFANKAGSCTGVVVKGTSKDMVLTAGRCVALNGHFHKNVTFVPAFGSTTPTSRPYGTWAARSVTSRTEWIQNANLRQDFGFVVLNKLNNKHIQDVVGAQTMAFNQSATQNYSVFGYAPSLGGNAQGRCNAPLASRGSPPGVGPLTLHVTCNLSQPPAAGGPWFAALNSAGAGKVLSVSSYRASSTDTTVYGPYFGAEAKGLYDFTKTL